MDSLDTEINRGIHQGTSLAYQVLTAIFKLDILCNIWGKWNGTNIFNIFQVESFNTDKLLVLWYKILLLERQLDFFNVKFRKLISFFPWSNSCISNKHAMLKQLDTMMQFGSWSIEDDSWEGPNGASEEIETVRDCRVRIMTWSENFRLKSLAAYVHRANQRILFLNIVTNSICSDGDSRRLLQLICRGEVSLINKGGERIQLPLPSEGNYYVPIELADKSCMKIADNSREDRGDILRNLLTCVLYYISILPLTDEGAQSKEKHNIGENYAAATGDSFKVAHMVSTYIYYAHLWQSKSTDTVNDSDFVIASQILSQPSYFAYVMKMRTDRAALFYAAIIVACKEQTLLGKHPGIVEEVIRRLYFKDYLEPCRLLVCDTYKGTDFVNCATGLLTISRNTCNIIEYFSFDKAFTIKWDFVFHPWIDAGMKFQHFADLKLAVALVSFRRHHLRSILNDITTGGHLHPEKNVVIYKYASLIVLFSKSFVNVCQAIDNIPISLLELIVKTYDMPLNEADATSKRKRLNIFALYSETGTDISEQLRSAVDALSTAILHVMLSNDSYKAKYLEACDQFIAAKVAISRWNSESQNVLEDYLCLHRTTFDPCELAKFYVKRNLIPQMLMYLDSLPMETNIVTLHTVLYMWAFKDKERRDILLLNYNVRYIAHHIKSTIMRLDMPTFLSRMPDARSNVVQLCQVIIYFRQYILSPTKTYVSTIVANQIYNARVHNREACYYNALIIYALGDDEAFLRVVTMLGTDSRLGVLTLLGFYGLPPLITTLATVKELVRKLDLRTGTFDSNALSLVMPQNIPPCTCGQSLRLQVRPGFNPSTTLKLFSFTFCFGSCVNAPLRTTAPVITESFLDFIQINHSLMFMQKGEYSADFITIIYIIGLYNNSMALFILAILFKDLEFLCLKWSLRR